MKREYRVPHHKEPEELIDGYVFVSINMNGRRHIRTERPLAGDLSLARTLCGRFIQTRSKSKRPVCKFCLRHYWYRVVHEVMKRFDMQNLPEPLKSKSERPASLAGAVLRKL